MVKEKYEQLKAWIRRNTHKILIRWCIRYLKRFYRVGYRYDSSTGAHSWHWTDGFEKAMGVNKPLPDLERELLNQIRLDYVRGLLRDERVYSKYFKEGKR